MTTCHPTPRPRPGRRHLAPAATRLALSRLAPRIRAKCRRLEQRNDLRLIVIDYLPLMQSGGSKRVESRQHEVPEDCWWVPLKYRNSSGSPSGWNGMPPSARHRSTSGWCPRCQCRPGCWPGSGPRRHGRAPDLERLLLHVAAASEKERRGRSPRSPPRASTARLPGSMYGSGSVSHCSTSSSRCRRSRRRYSPRRLC